MSNTKSFSIKLLSATLLTCILCTSLSVFSYIVHNDIETIDSMPIPLACFNADSQNEEVSADAPLGIGDMDANRNEAPDNMPAAIGQADGSVYVFQEEVESEDGTTSYIYTHNDSQQFDDGGLGDSELIISEN